jgi:hypothetical protein
MVLFATTWMECTEVGGDVHPNGLQHCVILQDKACLYMRQVERQVRWAGCLLQVTCHVQASTCLKLEAIQVSVDVYTWQVTWSRQPAYLTYLSTWLM